jgi:hypothetical protein
MKKFMILCLLTLCVSTALFSEVPGKWAVGILGGGGYITNSGFGNIAVSFVMPPLPFLWEIDFRFSSVPYTDLNFDYFIIDKMLVPDFLNGAIKWRIGVGGHTGLGLADDTTYFSLAVRLAAGLAWQLKIAHTTFEIFVRAVPSLGFQLTPLSGVYGGIGVGGGVRLWIE